MEMMFEYQFLVACSFEIRWKELDFILFSRKSNEPWVFDSHIYLISINILIVSKNWSYVISETIYFAVIHLVIFRLMKTRPTISSRFLRNWPTFMLQIIFTLIDRVNTFWCDFLIFCLFRFCMQYQIFLFSDQTQLNLIILSISTYIKGFHFNDTCFNIMCLSLTN